MTGDRSIRAATAGVVLAVAAFAAVVSYSHIYDLGRAHGQSGTAARLLPLSVDGLIVAAGLVLLHAARTGAPAWLARCMLWLGIAATVGANVSYGLPFGPLGAVVSAWPAVAFVGSAEMALGMVRSARVPVPVPAEPAAGNGLPAHLIEAQRTFAAELAAGAVPAIRRIRAELGVGQDKARQVQAHLAALAPAPPASGHDRNPSERPAAEDGPHTPRGVSHDETDRDGRAAVRDADRAAGRQQLPRAAHRGRQ